MPKNDNHDPVFTELLLFQHGGHDLKVSKMNNLSSKLDSAHLQCLKMTPMTLYLLSCYYFSMEVMTSMTLRSTK